jgi:hypothetical protein
MAVNYNSTVKTNRMRTTRDAIDSKTFVVGSGAGSAGSLVIGTSALSGAIGVLATVPLPNPSGSEAAGVLTLLGVPLSAVASAGGLAALAELRNNAGTVIVGGLTVGESGSGADIIIGESTIVAGQTVQVNSGTITHAA